MAIAVKAGAAVRPCRIHFGLQSSHRNFLRTLAKRAFFEISNALGWL
jgi:hypothetical protein